jgi:hypoxanthine-guanine phosphoribosyltransferase
VAAKYVGWDCPKEAFVVGYGLDFAGAFFPVSASHLSKESTDVYLTWVN